MSAAADLRSWLAKLPLVAILRGIEPAEAETVGEVLIDSGFRALEVPLNSPRPLDSISVLSRRFAGAALIGAGTVIDPADIDGIAASGGRLVAMPHGDRAVISAARQRGLICLPGVATPTEAFAALAAGADGLKLFPGELLTPAIVRAWRAVLPRDALLIPVGGIAPDGMRPYWEAGADGFGIGSALYKPGAALADIRSAARRFVAAFAAIGARSAG